MKKEQVQQV